jgi:hypothetical protein
MGWDVCWWSCSERGLPSSSATNCTIDRCGKHFCDTRGRRRIESHEPMRLPNHTPFIGHRTRWISRCRCKLRLDVARMLNSKGEGEQLKFLVSLLLLVSVATAHAQRNRQLKDAADDVRAARSLPNYTPPSAEPCNLNNRACKPKNAQELSRACGQLSVVASLTSVVNQESVERCRRFGFWPW